MDGEQTDAWRLQRREALREQAARRRRRQRHGGMVAAVLLGLGGASGAVLAADGGTASPGPRAKPQVGQATPPASPGGGARVPRITPAGSPTSGDARVIQRALSGGVSYIAVGSARRRDVALTFDDGPGPTTAAIVRELHVLRVPATFFVVGHAAAAMPQLLRREHRLGFAIGNHTQDHAFLSHVTLAAQAAQITGADTAIRAAGVAPLALFRPPYGSFTAQTLGLLARQRKLMVLWTVDTKDFARPGSGKIVYTALSGARPGAIILMHDGGGNRAQTAQALPRIVRGLRNRGFHIVTVPRLLREDPPPRRQPPPHSLSGP